MSLSFLISTRSRLPEVILTPCTHYSFAAKSGAIERHQQLGRWIHSDSLLGWHTPTDIVSLYLLRRTDHHSTDRKLSYIDKFGRRPTLLIGSTVLLISLVLFTVGIAVNTDSSNNLALAMLILFQITFGMSWNATPWIYAPEITPLQLRHVGSAVGVFSEWLWTFVSQCHHHRATRV